MGDEAEGLVAECELGVPEQGLVGRDHESAGHFQNRVGRSGLDPGGQFLGLGFQFRGQRLGHDDLRSG
jgi:hypothetical protein